MFSYLFVKNYYRQEMLWFEEVFYRCIYSVKREYCLKINEYCY